MKTFRSALMGLVILELVLCAVFFAVGHITGNAYFRGVGVGLLISWVTGALAYFVVKAKARGS